MAEEAEKQKEFEALLIKTLTGAGWKKSVRGEKLGKADMEFNNGEVTLQVHTRSDPGWIIFSIFESPEEGSDFAIRAPNELATVLNTITSFQNEISFDNYKEYLSQLVAVSPEIYVDTGDDLIPLKDE